MKHCEPHLIVKLIISAILKCTFIFSELKISYYSAPLVQDLCSYIVSTVVSAIIKRLICYVIIGLHQLCLTLAANASTYI